jgi:hypothetical protein
MLKRKTVSHHAAVVQRKNTDLLRLVSQVRILPVAPISYDVLNQPMLILFSYDKYQEIPQKYSD